MIQNRNKRLVMLSLSLEDCKNSGNKANELSASQDPKAAAFESNYT